MKFTLSWLKEHLDTTATLDQIAEALTDLGLEVEEVSDPAARLSAFTLARVVHAEQHPDADRLKLCRVLTDEGEKQIVCGAPNAREGITVVLAKPGDYVPGIDVTLSVGKIRGVESHGMMASERELELSDEHDGIIELPSGEVGQKFVDWLAENAPEKIDPTIDIAITPNRPDALGVRGIARDLAARGLGTLKPLREANISPGFPCPIGVTIEAGVAAKAPFFSGRMVRGVKNGPSPTWLQKRLTAIGLRPINLLVDITNFFTYDLNRPLHVFDAAKVTGDLTLRAAREGEEILALDDKTYRMPEGAVVICDENGPESIAGVMGGAASGSQEDTADVFIEAACFDPISTAATGRMLKINSDARYRFERGIDPEFTLQGLDLATQMVMELCGGEPSEVVTAGAIPDTARAYRLDPSRTASLVGLDIPEETQRATLEALGFRLEGDMAHVPSWRPDVQGEADLVEEIARIASLTGLEGKPLPRLKPGVPKPVLTPLQMRERTARRQTAALGYNECVTYSFIDQAAASLFGGGADAVRVENPISSEMTHLRPDLLPGLLAAAARNQARGFADLALFEMGPVFAGGEPGEQATQLTGLLVGSTSPRDPFGSRRKVDLYDAKADAEAVLTVIGAPAKAQINRKLDGWWHPGRAGNIALGPNVLATFGEIHPRVLRELDVKGPAVGFTIRIANIPFPKTKTATRSALNIAELQAVERDFAFVVDPKVEALSLVNAAQGADKALIERVTVFDQFTGLEGGRKSIAITARLQPRDKTLTDAEIEAVSQKIIDKVQKATGGVLRG
ncbi:phenylalanine--tRNA ligase subunit beta [Paracoccus saliphilus]|uniref:Phenylalanine--tRNA ligase beta subunit n=1 Tax=Paracoccus saliphilus TaxID=405559 RepID=A0AA46A443_9RHOB|nr:phenylalanine--tRNA ligase subunit beta [Paracoccus saliphilus]WCR03529.1 phenylalanine--tRNA ligase subunit beta [Paracoccus saliphilus]SIS55218.1 phenylalanyl-tRNA synthetase beta subunit [Paracoccus saliphilus]